MHDTSVCVNRDRIAHLFLHIHYFLNSTIIFIFFAFIIFVFSLFVFFISKYLLVLLFL